MNTTPDEDLLALWVEDELDSASRTAVDAWATAQPEWIERRDQARQVKSLLARHLPAAVEPPYAEFFNARIAREISRAEASPPAAAPAASPGKSWRWFLPASAAAGMALSFVAGTRLSPAPSTVAKAPTSALPAPVLYTPEKGVQADWFASESAGATVIVLDGLAAIPDSIELPDTASARSWQGPSTADLTPVSR